MELAHQAAHFPVRNAAQCAAPFLRLLSGRQLTAEQVGKLLSLLQGSSAAAAEACWVVVPGASASVMVRLASQPGMSAAAAGLGPWAASVADPVPFALVFGN